MVCMCVYERAILHSKYYRSGKINFCLRVIHNALTKHSHYIAVGQLLFFQAYGVYLKI